MSIYPTSYQIEPHCLGVGLIHSGGRAWVLDQHPVLAVTMTTETKKYKYSMTHFSKLFFLIKLRKFDYRFWQMVYDSLLKTKY